MACGFNPSMWKIMVDLSLLKPDRVTQLRHHVKTKGAEGKLYLLFFALFYFCGARG